MEWIFSLATDPKAHWFLAVNRICRKQISSDCYNSGLAEVCIANTAEMETLEETTK